MLSLRTFLPAMALSILPVFAAACSGAPDEASTESQEAPDVSGAPVVAGQQINIVSVLSGLSLDVTDIRRDDGALIQQYPYWKSANQRWTLTDMHDGSFEIVSVNSGRCVDIAYVSRDPGAAVQQWGCYGGANQRFRLVDAGGGASQIVSVNSGMCLDVANFSKAAGGKILQWHCTGADNQKWRLNALDGAGNVIGGGEACTDKPVGGAYTCAQQAGWGKCNEPWMQGVCDASCGRCGAGSGGVSRADIGMNIIPVLEPYMLGWNQKSVMAADPSRPFRVAHDNGIKTVRIGLAGRVEALNIWKADRSRFWQMFRHILDDARAQGLQVVVHNRLEQAVIEAMSGRTYANWGEAQRDVTTPGSAAWNGYWDFLRDAVAAVNEHPALYSWEVVNEPTWMLSYGDQVPREQVINFVNVFQGALHSVGAKRVHMGGALFNDGISDDLFRKVYEHTDILDAHLYTWDGGPTAAALLDQVQAEHDRVQQLTGRDLPIMLGEFATVPWDGFSRPIFDRCNQRGWTCLAWGFDAWDEHSFNEVERPEVMALIRQRSGR